MTRGTRSTPALPPQARRALARLGEDLRVARGRRGWSLREAAGRLFVSVPTLQRLERGQPGVGLGILAHALFLYGMVDRLSWLADPRFDLQSVERERRRHRGEDTEFDV